MSQVPVTKKATISADIFGSVLTITFRDGRAFEIDVAKLDPILQQQAMLHGIKQKLVDAAAIARSLDTGLPASINDKFEAVREVYERITSVKPTWNKERVAGETKRGANNLFLRALMQMTGKDRAYVDGFLESKSKEEHAALKKNKRVLQIMAELQVASAETNTDTDDLLAELGATGTVDVAARDTSDDEPETVEGEVVEAKVAKPKKARKPAPVTAE